MVRLVQWNRLFCFSRERSVKSSLWGCLRIKTPIKHARYLLCGDALLIREKTKVGQLADCPTDLNYSTLKQTIEVPFSGREDTDAKGEDVIFITKACSVQRPAVSYRAMSKSLQT